MLEERETERTIAGALPVTYSVPSIHFSPAWTDLDEDSTFGASQGAATPTCEHQEQFVEAYSLTWPAMISRADTKEAC